MPPAWLITAQKRIQLTSAVFFLAEKAEATEFWLLAAYFMFTSCSFKLEMRQAAEDVKCWLSLYLPHRNNSRSLFTLAHQIFTSFLLKLLEVWFRTDSFTLRSKHKYEWKSNWDTPTTKSNVMQPMRVFYSRLASLLVLVKWKKKEKKKALWSRYTNNANNKRTGSSVSLPFKWCNGFMV